MYSSMTREYGELSCMLYRMTRATTWAFEDLATLAPCLLRMSGVTAPVRLPSVIDYSIPVTDTYAAAGSRRTLVFSPTSDVQVRPNGAIYQDGYLLVNRAGARGPAPPPYPDLPDAGLALAEITFKTPNTTETATAIQRQASATFLRRGVMAVHGIVLSRGLNAPASSRSSIWAIGAILTELPANCPIAVAFPALAARDGPLLEPGEAPIQAASWDARAPADIALDGRTFANATIRLIPTDHPTDPAVQHSLLPVLLRVPGVDHPFAAAITDNAVALAVPGLADLLPLPLAELEPEMVTVACSTLATAVAGTVTLQVQHGLCVITALTNAHPVP